MTSLVAATTHATPRDDTRPSGARAVRSESAGGRARSTLRVLVGGTAWNALAQFVPLPINVVMTPYLIHHLGIDRWGLIALVTTVASIVSTFDGGFTGALNRYYAIYAGADDRSATTTTLTTVLVFVVGAGVVLGVAGWFLAPSLVGLFRMPDRLRPETTFYLKLVVALIALTFARNAIAGVIIARQRYALNSLLNVSTYGVWIVGLVVTVQGGWGLRGVGVTFLAQQFLATVIVVPPALRYLDRGSVRLLPRAETRKLFAYSAKIQVAGASNLANAEFDNLVIGTVLSVHSVALYNAGSGFAVQVTGVLRNALVPAGTYLARTFGGEGQQAAWRTFVRLQRIWAVACNAFYAAALGAAYYAIVDWLGPGFRVGGIIATIVVAGQAVLTMSMILGYYCMILGFAGIEVRVGLINVAVNVALTAALVFVGVLGVVIATVLAWWVSAWWLLHDTRRRISPSVPSFVDLMSLPASLVTVLCVFGMEYALHGVVPEGPIGLVGAAVPALVGLGIFLVIRFGPARLLTMIRDVVAIRSHGLRAMARHMAGAVIDVAGEPRTPVDYGVPV